MKIAATSSTESHTATALHDAFDALEAQLGGAPDLILAYASSEHDMGALVPALAKRAGDAPIHGGTSCRGVMTQDGFASKGGYGLGLWALRDPKGGYGSAMVELGDDAVGAGAQAVRTALEGAGRPGECPTMVWMSAAPGSEEDVIAGIASVIGPSVPVFGGSTADNTVEGHWRQFTAERIDSNSVVLSVLFPSVKMQFAFLSGHLPTQHVWTVTQAHGRTIEMLDGQPAAEVYNAATGGLIEAALGGGSILQKTALHPLGHAEASDEPHSTFLLSHPAAVTPSNGLVMFSEIPEGQQMHLMQGSQQQLIQRGSEVVDFALAMASWGPEETTGALVIYCAGCMLAVEDQMDAVVDGIQKTLRDNPFLGVFTFGEQGGFAGGANRHGNLMISAAVFGSSHG